jgi:hypothetical protein
MIAAVTINGTSWDTRRVLADVTIRQGRQAWGESSLASSATITLWDAPKTLPQECGVGVILQLDTAAGSPRFTGTVTDATATFPDPGRGANITLTATGYLATLARLTGGNRDFPEAAASARAQAIMDEASAGSIIHAIPQAADYRLAARPAKTASVLALLDEVAQSIGAVVYDLPTGEVLIQSLHARGQLTPHAIPAARILYAPKWRQVWEVENRVTVKWSGGEVVEQDSASVARWGLREATIETSLARPQHARQRCLDRLTRLAAPRWQLSDVVTDLPPDQLPIQAGDLALVATDQVAGLPLPGYPMVIEGWTDTQRGSRWQTTLHLSDGLMSFTGLSWEDIPPTDPAYQWATIDQAIPWTNALTLSDLKA